MNKWPSCKHFTSWLSLCPNNKITGGKIISTTSKKTTNRAAQAFRLAARSLYHSKSALGSYYRRVQAQHGPQLAIKALLINLLESSMPCSKIAQNIMILANSTTNNVSKNEPSTGSNVKPSSLVFNWYRLRHS